jgi:hypothetical protein
MVSNSKLLMVGKSQIQCVLQSLVMSVFVKREEGNNVFYCDLFKELAKRIGANAFYLSSR